MSNPLYEISSPALRCAVSGQGASIVGVQARTAGGTFMDIALSPESLVSGGADPSLAGRTVGPCCGRVRGAEAVVDGRLLKLTRNEGRNHLHGGADGCAHRRWTVCACTPSSILFSANLPDGLDGYPGNRALFAEYMVSGDALRVVYSATTDRPTWIDMTNHVYWDLSGHFDGSAMNQRLQIAASRVVFNDGDHLPREIVSVDEAFDFAAPRALSDRMARCAGHPQLVTGRGFNNAFILDPDLRRSMGCAARLHSPESGVTLEMDTDQPAIVLYSGGFLNADTPLHNPPRFASPTVRPDAAACCDCPSGADTPLHNPPRFASPGCAVALEAQGIPDPFHLPGATAEILRPGERYRREIIWRFTCQ